VPGIGQSGEDVLQSGPVKGVLRYAVALEFDDRNPNIVGPAPFFPIVHIVNLDIHPSTNQWQ
jgi:hypothetical protein